MLNKTEAKIVACNAIAELFGLGYFREHIKESCEAYPSDEYDEVEYEYFLGFESDDATGLWKVFARVMVNRETKECVLLDYKTPDGNRMKNPIKPTSFA